MKTIFFVAALIFSAAVSTVFSQSPTPSPTPDPNVRPAAVQSPQADPQARTSAYVRPDSKTRIKRYVNATVGPFALARQVVGAGIATWRNSPEEWGGQWEGFGKRVASNFGKNLIKQTTIYGLDSALKLDSHYYRSTKKDAASKIKNALLSPVTARNASGKRVIGVPRLVGTYTASIVAAEAWYPSRYDWKDGAKSATISLGIGAAYNLFKEFVWKK